MCMTTKKPKNTRLRAFFKGFASAFDITGGTSPPNPENGFAKDRAALQGDWHKIGNDMKKAMSLIPHE
jgi:hypothetical protein